MRPQIDKYLSNIQEQEADTSISALVALARHNGLQKKNDYQNRSIEQCRQEVGEERKRCKDTFKQRALTDMARAFQEQMRNCSKTRDPGQCNKRLREKANQYLEKAREIRI